MAASSTPAFPRTDWPAQIEALKLSGGQIMDKGTEHSLDLSLEPEIQTDKQMAKILPCRECQRPLVVNSFYAIARAQCRVCKGEVEGSGVKTATLAVVEAGKTDPHKAVNLADCLINPHFAQALCPVHPDDPEHVMELISVSHSPHYGPSEFIGYSHGRPQYRQIAKGEVARHQCRTCKALVTFDTTAQHQMRRINEVQQKPDLGDPHRHYVNDYGVQENRPQHHRHPVLDAEIPGVLAEGA